MNIRILYFLVLFLTVWTTKSQDADNSIMDILNEYCRKDLQINVLTLSSPDMYAIEEKDSQRDELFKVRASAVILPVQDNFFDKATKLSTIYGDLYLLKIVSQGALALNILSNDFFIPKGDVLILKSTLSNDNYITYTEQDNTTDGLFMSDYVSSDTLIMAYLQTKQTTLMPKAELQGVGYFYRDVSFINSSLKAGFNGSGSCEVNVNCSEGDNFYKQKHSVVRMMMPLNSLEIAWCTGTLINNTNYDRKPYVLTAAHCIEEMVSKKYLSQTVFYFNYEAPGCENPKKEPSKSQIRTGAELLTYDKTFGKDESDYMLLLLTQAIPNDYEVYWSGWNRTEDLVGDAVCIHHPAGDMKKISTVDGTLQDIGYDEDLWDYDTHCMVRWKKTKHGYGVTEGGSSGASLFDAQGRVLGVLSGGISTCSESAYNRVDWFGRLCYFFDKVKPWLDPQNTGVMQTEGMRWPVDVQSVSSKNTKDFMVYPIPTCDILNINVAQFEQGAEIVITNTLGNIVYTSTITANKQSLQLNVQSWVKGAYYVTLKDNFYSLTKKIIVE